MTGVRRTRPVLVRVLRVFSIVLLVIFALFGVVSWILFENKDDLLLDEIQSFVDQSQSGELEISDIELRLFRSFPDLTVELKGIRYFEHRDSLRAAGEKPILVAEHLFVALDLLPLLKDNVRISRVSISKAQIGIVQYPDGKLNFALALARPGPPPTALPPDTTQKTRDHTPSGKSQTKPAVEEESGSSVAVELDLIALDDVGITWKPANSRDSTIVRVRKVRARLAKTGSITRAKLDWVSDLESVHIGKKTLPRGTLELDGTVQFDAASGALTILKSDIGYDEFSATVSGKYSPKDSTQIDMEFDASSNDLELLSVVLKPEVLRQNPDLLKQGDIYLRGRVAGKLKSPLVDVSFGMKDLSLTLPRNIGRFNDIAFEGHFNSGAAPRYRDAILKIDSISGELPGGFIKGKFSVHNFADPYLIYDVNAQLKVDGFDEVFKIAAINDLKGLVSLQAKFDGPLKQFAQHQSDSSRSSIITLDSLSFNVVKTNQFVSNLSGVLETKYNKSTLKNFTLHYGRNNLTVNTTIDNFAYLLFKKSSEVVAVGKITSSQLYTSDFIPDTTKVPDIQDRISNLSLEFQVKTSDDSTDARIPPIDFSILNLSVALDRLPDIKSVKAKGTFRDTERGFKLDLTEFHADMEQGKLDVTGDLLFPAKRRFEFNARLQGDKFPMWYVQELITEIKTHKAGKDTMSIDRMHLITTSLDLTAAMSTRPFVLTNLVVRDAKINVQLADKRSISATKLNMLFSDLSLRQPGLQSVKGVISMKQLQLPGMGLMDLDLDLNGKDDKLSVAFSRGVPDTRLEKGNITADFSKGSRKYHLNYVVKGAKLENYIKKFSKQELMKGEVDYEVDLTASGSTMDSLKHSVAGTIEINGDSLDIYGVDVDRILRKFERSQHFNLTDLGAVLIAGPVGLAITKGTDFVSLATIKMNPGHHTFLQQLRTKWQLGDMVLTTDDVAFTTLENRIALIGAIDVGNDSIPSLNIAVVDRNGCALMEQELYGKMKDLKTGKIKIARTLLGSVINFGNKVVGKDCTPLYTGTVQAPEERAKGIKKLEQGIRKDTSRRAK